MTHDDRLERIRLHLRLAAQNFDDIFLYNTRHNILSSETRETLQLVRHLTKSLQDKVPAGVETK